MDQSYEKRLLSSPYKSPIKNLSPMKSPSRDHYSDRYIPVRTNAKWKGCPATELFKSKGSPAIKLFSGNSNRSNSMDCETSQVPIVEKSKQCDMLSTLIQNELSGDGFSRHSASDFENDKESVIAERENNNVFSFRYHKESPHKFKTSPYILSPVSEKSQRLLQKPQEQQRSISKIPYKVLDAPELHDDFYLNLVDWSSKNILAVGLGSCVYLWSAYTSKVYRLFDAVHESDMISSVAWHKKGSYLAVGTYRGNVQIWDIETRRRVRFLFGHDARVGALAWNSNLLATGSRDRLILLRDIRSPVGSDVNSSPIGIRGSRDIYPLFNTLSTNSRRPDTVLSSRSWRRTSKNCSLQNSKSFGKEAASSEASNTVDNQMEVDNQSELDSTPESSDCEDWADYPIHDRESINPSNPLYAVTGSARRTKQQYMSGTGDVTCTTENLSGDISEQMFRNDISNIQPARILRSHRQEVCGLRWSPDSQYLASGGNDNRLLIWDPISGNHTVPVYSYENHIAAVKAIAWSPHKHGLLASGGGTADRSIRFWNTLTGQALECVDTGSQVCNIAWSLHSNEFVTTHGYSENQILVWQYPKMNKLAKLTGHTYRVLYLAVSPDGENIVTGAGDETLRFWNVFTKNNQSKTVSSSLNLFNGIR